MVASGIWRIGDDEEDEEEEEEDEEKQQECEERAECVIFAHANFCILILGPGQKPTTLSSSTIWSMPSLASAQLSTMAKKTLMRFTLSSPMYANRAFFWLSLHPDSPPSCTAAITMQDKLIRLTLRAL